MIRIEQVKMPYNESEKKLYPLLLKKLHIHDKDVIHWRIFKKSIDARKKDKITAVYTCDLEIKNETAFFKHCRNNHVKSIEEKPYQFPEKGSHSIEYPIVVLGSGPAGLFCALMLAKEGYRPLLLERGSDVDTRQKAVQNFWETGELNPNTNVQFGEGGAGTFSDGKLNTLVKDPHGWHRKVLELFVEYGADPEILYINKPHIGTDVLCRIVKAMRMDILKLGGAVRFESKVTDIAVNQDHLKKICINNAEWIDCQCMIIAAGHSARDTFLMLKDHGMNLTRKSFAIGLRVEHPQAMINRSQYGKEYDRILGSASYKLTYRASNGRGVYSFCMCPGGYVVNASSEEGRLVVNGMSYHGRNSDNANSAIVVTVSPEDFMSDDVLAGVEFQRHWEEMAFKAGRGKVPIQLYGDYKAGRKSTEFGKVQPVHKGSCEFADLNGCLPEYAADAIKEGIQAFGKKIQGFDREDVLLSGVETRTSSPIRMERDASFQSNIRGIYPCGEGAGYAGGITSAAMDGLRIAEAVGKVYKPFE